jgi:hypothetical protein
MNHPFQSYQALRELADTQLKGQHEYGGSGAKEASQELHLSKTIYLTAEEYMVSVISSHIAEYLIASYQSSVASRSSSP